MENGKEKKTTVNLAVDSKIINEIKLDARSKGMSLNARVNAILSKYVSFYRRVEEIHTIIIPPRQWKEFLDMLDENKTAEIMKNNHGEVVAHYKHNKIPITKESLIQIMFENMSIWTGMCTKFNHYVDDQGFSHLIFDHEFDIKWSTIVSNVFSDLINETLGLPTQTSVLPHMVEIKIMERED